MPQTFTEFAAGLWVAQSALFDTNAGIWLSAGRALLIDPGIYPAEIDAVRDFVAARGATPAAIVLTHSHWDHLLGPERLPGLRVIAQSAYPETASLAAATIRSELGGWERAAGIARAGPFAIPAPDELWPGDPAAPAAVHPAGELELVPLHVPGHAPDQLALYHPPSATLWAADILSDLEIPFVSHNLAAYRRTLAHLAALELRVLVPGHGRATADPQEIRARLAEDTAYLDRLAVQVERAVAAGLALDEARARCAAIPFRLPERNADAHRLNVESAYIELGGPADPRAAGWGQTRVED